MSDFINRYPLNVPGKFYIDDQCTDCDLCRECAPNNVRRDDRFGHSYVFKQPESDEEVAGLMEGVEGCPTEAVGCDGDEFNWPTTPIKDWNEYSRIHQWNISFDLHSPTFSYAECEQRDRARLRAAIEARNSATDKRRDWRRIFRFRK